MKRKITSLICGLALMLTMFCVPVGAAEQFVAYDSGTLKVDGINYNFTMGVVTASAVTEGESTGLKSMSCSMYTVTDSGVHPGSDSGPLYINVTISGYGEISEARSECTVSGGYGNVVMELPE